MPAQDKQDTNHILYLGGCRPVPLAHYLKALGCLRTFAQVEPQVRGSWYGESFQLHTKHDQGALVDFYLHRYVPTPLLSPWNGGSGFYPKDNQIALLALEKSKSERFAPYRETIQAARRIVSQMALSGKPSDKEKHQCLQRCRNTFPDHALQWLDAAFVLTMDGPKFPFLLGTGGNDGRLEFTRNFMERINDLFCMDTGTPRGGTEAFLRGALFGEPHDGLGGGAIGQFFPGAVGGLNASNGFDADSLVNPWDYILMFEGVLLFATAASRRLHTTKGSMSYPFMFYTNAAGSAHVVDVDESSHKTRGELWLPLWRESVSLLELQQLLNEGRIQLGRQPARDGLDAIQAVSHYGVARGIHAFERVGFQMRNGPAYLAVPLGRFEVTHRPEADLLHPLRDWLVRFRQKARGDRAPASIRRALRQLEDAVFALCQGTHPRLHALDLLVALGRCERAMVASLGWTIGKAKLRPIPRTHAERWLHYIDEDSPELRLASCLAATSVWRAGTRSMIRLWRVQMEPVGDHPVFPQWNKHANKGTNRKVTWQKGSPLDSLVLSMQRRILAAQQTGATSFPDRSMVPAQPSDLAALIDDAVDLVRFDDLLWGMILLDWHLFKVPSHWRPGRERGMSREKEGFEAIYLSQPPALYTLLKLCFSTHSISGQEVPIHPQIFRLIASGDGTRASELAARRLRGSGFVPALTRIHLQGSHQEQVTQRIAAALCFPLAEKTLQGLASSLLRPDANHTTPNLFL